MSTVQVPLVETAFTTGLREARRGVSGALGRRIEDEPNRLDPGSDRHPVLMIPLRQNVMRILAIRRHTGCSARPPHPQGSRWTCAPE
ncbi:MAG: hypothetical protein M3443_19560 [Actinomycetota bacterium]|nr:hypothetical protein [Actinomycetota bacterium]